MVRIVRAPACALLAVACAGTAAFAAGSEAPDPTTLIAGLRVKVQQKQKLEARQPVVQETVNTEQHSIDASTQDFAQKFAPIKAQHDARCHGTFQEPEYSSRVSECNALEAQARQLGANYESEIAPHKKKLDEANAELATNKQTLQQLDSSIRSINLQLRVRFPSCSLGGSAESVVDCFQHVWDQNRIHDKTAPQVGGPSLGVVAGNDPVLRDYQRRFDALEAERRTIEQRLEALANQPGTGENLVARSKLKERISAIGSAEAYLRFKAMDHARH
jgi:hypothetical protein